MALIALVLASIVRVLALRVLVLALIVLVVALIVQVLALIVLELALIVLVLIIIAVAMAKIGSHDFFMHSYCRGIKENVFKIYRTKTIVFMIQIFSKIMEIFIAFKNCYNSADLKNIQEIFSHMINDESF